MAHQDQQPSTSSTAQPGKQDDPIKTAWTDMVERVSVAGWKEALSEEVSQIRRMFQLILLVFSVLSIYYSVLVISQWIKSSRKDDIEDIYGQNHVPFSNVTICAQLYLNQTFVMKNVSIPELILQRNKKYTAEELYRQLTIFLSVLTRPHSISPVTLSYFTRIVSANAHVEDYSAFLDEAALQCPQMLRRCWFNRVEFDCCKLAVRSIDDDGICYGLALNMDSDNAVPSGNTFQQTRAGPGGGLTVEVSVPLEDFPWLEDEAGDGFRVYVNPVPYSIIQSPLGAPSQAETFIKVAPAKRHLTFNCAGHGKLGQRPSLIYYDPDGFDCMIEALIKTIENHGSSCATPLYLFRPNSSIVCNPAAVFVALSTFSRQDIDQFYQSLSADIVGISRYQVRSALESLQTDWQRALTDASRCKKHCVRWTYDSSSSFSNLEPKEVKDEKERNRMFSRINVYYGDLSYRKYQEVIEYSSYLAFCDFGNVVGLYWGMSVVSFLHVLYYVPRYVYIHVCRFQQKRRVIAAE